jgi:hypothetical protein
VADPREVVDLAGTGTLADGVGEAHLGDELRRWRGVVARRRLLALARRHAVVGLGLAVPLEVLALLGGIPQGVVVAAPAALFVVSVSALALRGPSPFGLARLLDDKLRLNDRLATALEIEARADEARSPLERRTVADAAALVRAGRDDWRARPARPGRTDRVALAGVVAALAAVVAVGALAGGGSSSGPTEALAPKGGGGAGGAPGEQRRKRAEDKAESHAAPTGKLHKIEGRRRLEQSAIRSTEEGYQQVPQGARSGRKGKAAGAKGSGKGGPKNAPTGKLNTTGSNKAGRHRASNGGRSPTAGNKEKEHPTVGFNVKGQKKHKGSGRRGSSEVSGAGTKKSAPNGQGDETSAGSRSAKSGVPSGAGKAGGEQGTNRQGHATPIKGQASQAVKIQPGYAPARSTKGGPEHNKAGDEQGAGGKARTAQVTGATQVGDEFSFVPAAGGAVPGPSAGLQLNYLESLKWVQRLPW